AVPPRAGSAGTGSRRSPTPTGSGSPENPYRSARICASRPSARCGKRPGMFTGLVEDMGTVARADRRSDALVLAIRPARLPVAELAVGESVCHDGACLTVTEVGRDTFSVL